MQSTLFSSAGKAASDYLQRGWLPLPIPPNSKTPRVKNWQTTPPPVAADWHGNVGVLLGEPSGGLIDLDIDHPLAVELADHFLPSTNCEFGRAGKPRSHRLYYAHDCGTHKRQSKPHGMLVELHSTGAQTVFPGSTHPSGEPIEWHTDGEPTTIPAAELKAAVDALADEVERRLAIKKRKRRNSKDAMLDAGQECAGTSALDRCRNYIARMPGAVSGQGGHAATYAVACKLFRFGLSLAEARALMGEYNQRCSPPWTDAEIDHKLADAQKEVEAAGEVGSMERSADSSSGVANYDTLTSEDDNKKLVSLSMQEIIDRTRKQTGDWPRRVRSALFIDDAAHGIGWLAQPADLFGWLSRKVGRVNWAGGKGLVKQPELFAELRRTAKIYLSIEELPHEPPLANHYYRRGGIEPGDGSHLRELLDRFTPATDIDRDLLLAAFITPVWGGPFGSRPAFLFTSDIGRGVGKSTAAKMVARLWGGDLSFSGGDDANKMRTRLLSPEALTKRVALLDNIKAMRFSWADWEAMLTADTIGGHRMYVGEATRPNALTWIVTLNGASLSTDVAQRVVVVKFNAPRRSGSWEEETARFIDEHRQQLVADCIGFLRGPIQPLRRFTRWASWERDIFQRLPTPDAAQRIIMDRQRSADVEADEAEIVQADFHARLEELDYDTDTTRVFIPSSVAGQWFGLATNERIGTVAAGRKLGQLIDEGRLPRMARNACRSRGRGVVWIGAVTDASEVTQTDIESGIDRRERRYA